MQTSASSEEVAQAFLHLARLAASRSDCGVTFLTAEPPTIPYEADEHSCRALAEVVKILLADRKRVRRRMVEKLAARAFEIVTLAFKDAQVHGDPEEVVEDVIESRLLKELGFQLTEREKSRFARNASLIKEDEGPKNAAAEALGKAFGLASNKFPFESEKRAKDTPAVPAPGNRWVPLADVRRFVDAVFHAVEAERRGTAVLPLSALRSSGNDEALVSRVESCFQADMRKDLDNVSPTVLSPFFLALLRGENPAPHLTLWPELEREWIPVRAAFVNTGTLIHNLWLSMGFDSPLLLQAVADHLSQQWLATYRHALGLVSGPSSEEGATGRASHASRTQ